MQLKATQFQDMLNKLPTAGSLKSDPITVNLTNRNYAPPALTNQWAAIITGRDPLSYMGFAAPPIYQDSIQAEIALEVDGVYEEGKNMTSPLTYTWHPERVERQCEWLGISVTVKTAISVRSDA